MMIQMHCQMHLLPLRRSEMMKIRLFVRPKDIVHGFEDIISCIYFLIFASASGPRRNDRCS